jgi:hypothetical protein
VPCFRPESQIGEWKGKEIAFSPDLIIAEGTDDYGGEWLDSIGEIKKCWMSSRVKPTDKEFAKYLTQGRMYAYFLGMQRITYFVNHTVGNWRDYPFPQMRLWTIEITKREIMDEMKTMMAHAENEDLFAKAEAGLLRDPASLPGSTGERARSAKGSTSHRSVRR